MNNTTIPCFDGRAENFVFFRKQVELWTLITPLKVECRAPALVLAMCKMPQEIALGLGMDVLQSDEGITKVLDELHTHLAPDATDVAFTDIMGFILLRRDGRTLDEYSAEFHGARRRAEARLPTGSGFPDTVLSALCIYNAGISPQQ